MAQQHFLSPDRLYERPFAAAHPFVRSPSAPRRWTMLSIFVFLCTIIGAYLYVTDVKRVRRMAETELSRVLGGPVTVGRAKLSIFEGLRLENVQVYVDATNGEDPQSRLFSANLFLVNYDIKALLTGRLKLTQIIAIDPHVQLIEDLETARWNYQPMLRQTAPATRAAGRGSVPVLPEIILRNAKIDYREVRRGELVSRGSMTIEGQLSPSSDGQRYSFELQSRGGDARGGGRFTMGPTVSGVLVRGTGQVTAQLRDFEFGQDIRSMLPAEVRSWWDRHALNGAVDVPVLTYMPGRVGETAKFKVETDLRDVELTVRPEEWMSRAEIEAHEFAADAFATMRAVGLDTQGVVTAIQRLVEPSPIQLAHVEGRFAFTEDGLVLGEFDEKGVLTRPVRGVLEKNEFAIDGRIEGYSPQSPATIHMASQRIQIPASPRYITSMPKAVRELYDHLRPSGVATLDLTISRPTAGARIDLSGGVQVVDGNFVFDRFPYPVHKATGSVMFGYDEAKRWDQVKIDLRGYGNPDGPNRNSIISIVGLVAPLNGDPSVFVKVNCDSVHDEPLLHAAFPQEVKETLKNLDADGKGEYPKFKGSFECRVNRPVGPDVEWIVDTDITLTDAAGKMVVFPYFMEHVTGKLAIREGFVDIIAATMKKEDSSLVIDGRVTWRAGFGRPLEAGEAHGDVTPPRPDLKVTARNVAIDQQLLDALPADRRQWMQDAGLTGKINIDGRVWRPSSAEAAHVPMLEESNLTHSFDITLRDGSLWPAGGKSIVTTLAGTLHLLPDRLKINEMKGKRGEGDLSGHGEVSWPKNKPAVAFSGSATKLVLDQPLYRVLPAVAQQAWDAVRPEGMIDLDLSYRGAVGVAKHDAATQPATQPAAPDLELLIRPRTLAATVQAVPYRLENLTGTVRVVGNMVTLTDVSGKHGPAVVRVSGGGIVSDQSTWELRLSATDVAVDEAFRKSLPPALASLVDSLKLKGTIGFDFTRLGVQTLPADQALPRASAATTAPNSAPVDMDFAVKLALADASLDVGVPLTKVTGTMDLSGTVKKSKLASFQGPIDLPELTIAGREAHDVHAEFYKPADQDALRIGRLNGMLAAGEVAGQVDLAFPDVGPQRYAMNLVLRDANVRQLSGETAPDLTGELSASLALEGDWTDPRSRRGRGDVAVSGKQMYKIPLVLGLLQITNLSLPITSPFNEGSARYTVEGQMVTFESLELRSRDMLMSGSGQLDFGEKKVAMTFTTDNPNWPKLPIIGDIVQTAKHELLQIHVKGKLEESSLGGGATNTVNTTVEEVERGDGKAKK